MTPLETLQALKIKYEVASSEFEKTLEVMRQCGSRTKKEELKEEADDYAVLISEIVEKILAIKLNQEYEITKTDTEIIIKPKMEVKPENIIKNNFGLEARENPMSDL